MTEDFHKQKTKPDLSSDEKDAQAIPKMIGPYKIESLLDKGGMSILDLGTHPETKEPVTVKVLSNDSFQIPMSIASSWKQKSSL